MNYVYDIVLNFFDYKDVYEFYEWNKEDKLIYIEKIPIFKVNPIQMQEICFSKIKVDDELLSKIKNKTIFDNGCIKYSLLITDYDRVVALEFNNKKELLKKSYLLLDEEDAVIDECSELKMEEFKYEVIDSFKNNSFFTRREKYIQNYLLNEIKLLYRNKNYDELDYLYYELFMEDDTIDKKYNKLVNSIKYNFDDKFDILFNVISLSKQGILNN